MKCFRFFILFLLALPYESIVRGLPGTKGKKSKGKVKKDGGDAGDC